MYTLNATFRNLRTGASRVWLGGLAIALSVAFVVAGTLVAEASRARIVEPALSAPVGTTGVIVAESGRLPAAAAELGVAASDRTVVLFGPDGRSELAGERRVFLADGRAVRMVSGELPGGADEIALDSSAAGILGLGAGDSVPVRTEDGSVVVMRVSGTVVPRTGTTGVAATVAGMERLLGPGVDQVQLRGSAAETADAVAALGDAVRYTDLRGQQQQESAQAGRGLGVLGLLLSTLTVVCAVAGTFVIANTFYVVAAGRRREAALLRAVGATKSQVRRVFAVEALSLGTVASVIGVVAGASAGTLVGRFMGFHVAPDARLIVVGLVLGMVVTLAGTWGPVRGIAQVAPVAALGAAELTEVERPSQVRWALVLPLVIGAALAVQVPIVGAVIGGVLTFIALVVLGPILVPRIGRIVVRGRGPVAKLARANVVRYPKRSARTSVAVVLGVALATSVTALVTAAGNLAELMPESIVTVYAPTVTTDMEQVLSGLPGVDSVDPMGPSELRLNTSPALTDEVATEVAGQLPNWPGARLGTDADRAAEYSSAVAWITTSLGAVAAMSLIVGLLGVLNTVRLAALERRREFAVLRAIGMTRGQLVRLVVREAMGLAGIGVFLGLVLGAATIYGMLGMLSLLLIPLISWWLVASICVAVLVVAAVGAVFPARAAARVSPAYALADTTN
ncbi:MAG: FtsX-like permease family protein [Actinobacteria bacterium]|nr:FtsX-like permease family protein [Actinomycetota bacterium]MCB9413163.1 FtsX-like permease family protein [Actinomycetota bacterium]